jgi:hypothetical protein
MDDGEQEVLKAAGLVGPSNRLPNAMRPELIGETPHENDVEKAKPVDVEQHEGRPKVRRSLQRALREANVPTHHRSKKGKDSASSAGMTEDASSLGESEGLPRGAGSFTVHGKKASVITFGSEWQDMSPEERLRLRKVAQHNQSKILVPSAGGDGSGLIESTPSHERRPLSVISISTATTRSVTAGEEKEGDSPMNGDQELRLMDYASVERWRTSQSLVA